MLMILGFKRSHDPQECKAILHRNVEDGNGGVTRLTMTKACNLEVPTTHAADPRPGPALETTGVHVPQTSPLQVPGTQQPRMSATNSLTPRQLRRRGIAGRAFGAAQSTHEQRGVLALSHNCCSLVTVAMVQRTKEIWPDVNTATCREAIFDSLIREGLVKTLPRRGKVVPFIPVIFMPQKYPALPPYS